jgi:hypothetical protein
VNCCHALGPNRKNPKFIPKTDFGAEPLVGPEPQAQSLRPRGYPLRSPSLTPAGASSGTNPRYAS